MLSIEETLEWIDGQIYVGQLHLNASPLGEAKTESEILFSVSVHARVTTLQQLRGEITGEGFDPEASKGEQLREW